MAFEAALPTDGRSLLCGPTHTTQARYDGVTLTVAASACEVGCCNHYYY